MVVIVNVFVVGTEGVSVGGDALVVDVVVRRRAAATVNTAAIASRSLAPPS